MRNRIFRLLVCLVLVCVILVNCSPIRAQALEPVTTALAAGTVVLAAALIGLGISAGDNADAFVDVVQRLSTHEKILPYLDSDGNIHISRFGLEDGQLSPWLIPAVLLQVIRQVLFDEEVVTGSSLPEGYAYYGDYLIPVIDSIWDKDKYPYACIDRLGDDYYIVMFSQMPQHIESSGYIRFSGSGYVQSSLKYSGSNSWDYDSRSSYKTSSDSSGGYGSYIWSNYDIPYDSDGSLFIAASEPVYSNISVSEGLVAGEIAPLQQELTEGYPTWGQGQIQDQDENYWMPIGLDQTLEETMRLTQQQVQLGEGTFEQTQDQEQEQTQIPGLIQGFQDKVNTWFARLSLTVSNILDTLVSVPQQLLTGLQNLFVPDAQMMAQQQVKWTTLLSDRFGAVYDSVALIDNIAGAFTLGATQTQIRFPLITIPFADVTWEFGGWMVDVVPDGFQVLVDALKVGIDILCTLAFVNAMKNRLERVLEGRG